MYINCLRVKKSKYVLTQRLGKQLRLNLAGYVHTPTTSRKMARTPTYPNFEVGLRAVLSLAQA